MKLFTQLTLQIKKFIKLYTVELNVLMKVSERANLAVFAQQ